MSKEKKKYSRLDFKSVEYSAGRKDEKIKRSKDQKMRRRKDEKMKR